MNDLIIIIFLDRVPVGYIGKAEKGAERFVDIVRPIKQKFKPLRVQRP